MNNKCPPYQSRQFPTSIPTLRLACLFDGPFLKPAMSVILCTAGYDHTIRFWEALSGICSRTIQHPDSQVNRLCISPDKRFLAAAGHHTVKLYDIKSTNPNPLLTFDGHTGNVTGVAFHCEGKWMVTSSEDGTVKIWETRSGTIQRSYSHGSSVNDVVIHPNQGEIISCDRSGSVRVWDLAENNCSHQLIPEEDVSVSSVTVASDGSLLCAANNAGNVFVWKLIATYERTNLVPVTQFSAHKEYITRILLSPDVKKLATCSADHTAKIWEVTAVTDPPSDESSSSSLSNNAHVAHPPMPTNGVNGHNKINGDSGIGMSIGMGIGMGSIGVNGVGGGLGMSVGGGIGGGIGGAAGDPKPYPLEATLTGHQRWVWDCAFSADSAYLVTACSDHYARLWELHSQQVIRQYNGHHRGAVCVALNDYSEAR
ncbi:quinon protein alcohol dehydrogenase-like superfamily [Hypoxylon sp. NC1633]|nr:quinon protein alcohol dehydrogenase-like superfamily [Hypoxylon sp. NC1633]